MLRYHVPNWYKDPEGFANRPHFIFHLFCSESESKTGQLPSYCPKLNEPGVLDIINCNIELIDPFSDLIDDTWL